MQNLKGTYSKGRREKLERKDEPRKKKYTCFFSFVPLDRELDNI